MGWIFLLRVKQTPKVLPANVDNITDLFLYRYWGKDTFVFVTFVV
jgi:hypothetical protein